MFSCSKSDKVESEKIIVKLEKAIEINGFSLELNNDSNSTFFYPTSIGVDSKENIYILDNKTSSIKKFDKTGRFIKSFCKNGIGPGEVRNAYEFVIIKDSLYIEDTNLKRMVQFDSNGLFIKNIPLKDNTLPMLMKVLGKNKLICLSEKLEKRKDGYHKGYDLNILNNKFEKEKTLSSLMKKYDPKESNYLSYFTSFTTFKNNIYVAENSEHSYRIHIYNEKGIKKSTIVKNYSKISFNDDELTRLNSDLQKLTGKEIKLNKRTFKRAINYIYNYSNKNLLLVFPSTNKIGEEIQIIVDIYKNDKFLIRTKMIGGKFKISDYFNLDNMIWFIYKDKLYHLSSSEAIISVYNISI